MTLSPCSVCTRSGTFFDCVDTSAVVETTALITIAIRTALTRITCVTPVTRLEAIGERELELAAVEHVRSARVLSEARVAHQVDVAAGQQVLVVEQVEHVGAEFEVIAADGELLAEREVGVVDEHAACGVASVGRAVLAPARIAGRADTGAVADRVAGI